MKITKMQWIWITIGAIILLGMCGNKSEPVSRTAVTAKVSATNVVVATSTVNTITETKTTTKSVVIQSTNTVVVEPTKMASTAIPTVIATTIAIEDKSAAPCKTGQIKGSQNGIYHIPGGRDYKRTKKNVTCFDNVEDAKAAGFIPTANP
jgi:hypothetical protein